MTHPEPLLLYLRVLPEGAMYAYAPLLSERARVLFPQWLHLEMDSHSDQVHVAHLLRAAQQTPRLLLAIDAGADSTLPTGKVGEMLTRLRQRKLPTRVLFHGHHPLLEKMSKLPGVQWQHAQTEEQALALLEEWSREAAAF